MNKLFGFCRSLLTHLNFKADTEFSKNRDMYKGDENLLTLVEFSRANNSKSKSVKRVKFSETKFEYDEQI